MASNSGWTTGLPSGNSKVANTDEEFRSFKSFMEAWWEQEHYATSGSASSAGIAKHGSGRAFVGTASQLSNPTADNDGRLFHATDTGQILVGNVSTSSWSAVADSILLSSQQTFTALQEFTSDISASDIAVGNAFQGIVSGFTVLANNIGVAASSFGAFQIDGTSALTASDPIIMGFEQDESDGIGGVRLHLTGAVWSDQSVEVLVSNPSSSRRTLPSGTTVRYLAFRYS